MKITTIASLSIVALLAACSSTQTSAPGAVGAKKAECCSAKTECSATKAAAPGAVGEKKSGCCAEAAKAAPGAVSGKSDCASSCATKTECSAAKAAPGAVSGKSDCASKCPASK
jgi:hypothetical protein